MRAFEHVTVGPFMSVEEDTNAPSGDDVVVEAKLVWGGEILAVKHARPARVLRLRDLGITSSKRERARIVARRDAGGVVLVTPSGDRLPRGCKMSLRLGRATLTLSLVSGDLAPLPRGQGDGRLLRGVAYVGVLHAAVLAFAFLAEGTPPGGASIESVAIAPAHIEIEAQALVAATSATTTTELAASETSSRTNEVGPSTDVRAEVRPSSASPSSRRDEKASSFGVVAILTKDTRTPHALRSFVDFDPPLPRGFTEPIDDVPSLGGLSLSGIGEGGGGSGRGIPIAPAPDAEPAERADERAAVATPSAPRGPHA